MEKKFHCREGYDISFKVWRSQSYACCWTGLDLYYNSFLVKLGSKILNYWSKKNWFGTPFSPMNLKPKKKEKLNYLKIWKEIPKYLAKQARPIFGALAKHICILKLTCFQMPKRIKDLIQIYFNIFQKIQQIYKLYIIKGYET